MYSDCPSNFTYGFGGLGVLVTLFAAYKGIKNATHSFKSYFANRKEESL